MKKLLIGLGVILSSYSAQTLASLPCYPRADVNLNTICGGFTFGLTGLYWRPSSLEEDFATGFTNLNAFFGDETTIQRLIDIGPATQRTFDHDYHWGGKANIGYLFPCYGYDINLTYTHWDDTDHGYTNDPAVFPAGLQFLLNSAGPVINFVSITPPGLIIPGELRLLTLFDSATFVPNVLSTDVSASRQFKDNTWDLDFGQTLRFNCFGLVHWYAGLRYSKLEYDQHIFFNSNISGSSVPTGTLFSGGQFIDPVTTGVVIAGTFSADVNVNANLQDVTTNYSEFHGVGPRVGFDVNYLFCGGFGVVGGLSAALLVGEAESTFTERSSMAGIASFTDFVRGTLEAVVPILGVAAIPITAPAANFVVPFADDTGVLAQHHPDVTRVIPNIDAKIGLNYIYQFCNCSRTRVAIEAGYMVSHYFNSIEKFDLAGIFDPSNPSRDFTDTNFDGPYISVQVAL